MAKHYTIADETRYVAVTIDDDLTTVVLYDEDTNLEAKAHALRYIGDAYDENIGINVAYNRAVQRLARKTEKYYIRKTVPTNAAAYTS